MIFRTVQLCLFVTAALARSSSLHARQNSTQSPPAVYANFPSSGPATTITGVLEFHNLGTAGVEILSSGATALHSFPAGEGPFLYHIHVNPVPANGSCDATGAHFDPMQVGETPPCNPSLPQYCQYGDLAGKYGTIQSDPFKLNVTDTFLSFDPTNWGYFLGRSVVIHAANKTRIACANLIESKSSAAPTANSPPAASSTGVVIPTPGGNQLKVSAASTNGAGWILPSLTFVALTLGVVFHF